MNEKMYKPVTTQPVAAEPKRMVVVLQGLVSTKAWHVAQDRVDNVVVRYEKTTARKWHE
jgi:hypothetical protein